jgi:hypothetical protein
MLQLPLLLRILPMRLLQAPLHTLPMSKLGGQSTLCKIERLLLTSISPSTYRKMAQKSQLWNASAKVHIPSLHIVLLTSFVR